jgi:uncharacterized protein YegP (UPF0339 family)
MPCRFVLKKSGNGFNWDLRSKKGKVIATSEHYETRRAAMAGIEAIRKKARGAKFIDAEEQSGEKASAKTSSKKAPAKRTSKKVPAKRASKKTPAKRTSRRATAQR